MDAVPSQVVSTSPNPRLPAPRAQGHSSARSRLDWHGASYPGRWVVTIAIRVGWPQPNRPGPGARSGVAGYTVSHWRDAPWRMVDGRGRPYYG